LIDLAERTRATFRRLLTSFRLIEDEPTRVQGNDGYILGGTYTQGVYTLRARELLEVKNGVVYVVAGTDTATDWPVQEATPESTLETFRPT